MTYDLTDLHAPRAAGALLKTFVALVENPLSGSLLANKLLGDAGILALRDVPTDDLHPLHPPGLPASPLGRQEAPSELGDISTLPGEAGALPGDLEGVGDFLAAYRSGEHSPSDVATAVLEAVAQDQARNPAMRALISVQADDVVAQAAAATERWREGKPLGPLDGVPVAVKDELDQRGHPTTVGTAFLGRQRAAEDAAAVARLRAAGAVLIGKANMHEIGLGVTGLNPVHGAARNPYDPERATGGSSSGSAAAVAAGLCPLAVGADGGGSIRIPAALCGQVGLKATYGRVSERGAAPLCWSVAHVGPIAVNARDAALGYAIMAGPDGEDPNSLGQPAPHLEGFEDDDLSGLRVGIYRPWFEHADPEIVAACERGLDRFKEAGARIVDVEIPELGLLRTVHLVTIISEMATAHARYYEQHRAEYGLDTRLNLALARRLNAYDYIHAQRHRVRLSQHFTRALTNADVLVTPATGTTAPLLPPDALLTGESNLNLVDRLMRFAPAANLTGLPAISFPVAYDDKGLPIGMQLMGRPWAEHTLLRMARVMEPAVERRAPRVHHQLLG